MRMTIRSMLFLAILVPQTGLAQNPLSQQRQVEVGLGLATPFLQGGTELLRARALRSNRQSFFQDEGVHRDVGRYPALVGFSLHLAFDQPVSRVNGLMLGAAARTTLTGSQPSGGGYEEGYFFNTITTGMTAKYYPLSRSNVYLRGEAGVGAVLTKNRFRDAAGMQAYHHQFGIGPAGALGVGYSITPFHRSGRVVHIQALYQQLRSRVEVDGIGDDHWTTGALHLMLGVGF